MPGRYALAYSDSSTPLSDPVLVSNLMRVTYGMALCKWLQLWQVNTDSVWKRRWCAAERTRLADVHEICS